MRDRTPGNPDFSSRSNTLVVLCIFFVLLIVRCGKGKGDEDPSYDNLPPVGNGQTLDSNTSSPVILRKPDSFAGIIKKVRDVVVTISTRQIVTGQPQFGFPFGFLSPYDYPVQKKIRTGLGSGFVIDKSGIVITNNHVVKNASEVLVQLPDKREFPAGIVGKDARLDIAVLQIPEQVSMAAVLGDSEKLEVGDWVIAIGNPLGLANSVTAGIVSARGRSSWDLWGEIPGYADFIQTDASINPGNSGGPLVNLDGEVIGVNTAIIKEGQGIGFAIPINMVKQILPQLIKEGHLLRAWMGIYLGPVDSDTAKKLGLKTPTGALVAEVVEGGPAFKAGFQRVDVIVEFAGKKITNAGKLPWIIATSPLDEPVKVKIIRNGKEKQMEVVLLPMPQNN